MAERNRYADYSFRGILVDSGISRETLEKSLEEANGLIERGMLPVCDREPLPGEPVFEVDIRHVVGLVRSLKIDGDSVDATVSIIDEPEKQQLQNKMYREMLAQGPLITLKMRGFVLPGEKYRVISLDLVSSCERLASGRQG